MRKVMVFGTFDGLHEGHRDFLRQAKECGDYLIAEVAQDHIVGHLKGHLPALDLAKRLEALKKEDGVDEVEIGDTELYTWQVAKKHRPDVVAVGYDQTALKNALEAHLKNFDWPIEIRVMNAHEPDKYHSSLFENRI